MKKRFLISVIISLVAMFLIPWLAITFIAGNDALGILLLLTVILNPLVSVAIGIIGGQGEKAEWYLPLINAVIYLLAAWVVLGFDFTYVISALVYFAIGIAAVFITLAVKRKRK